jgi:hypothetical protein
VRIEDGQLNSLISRILLKDMACIRKAGSAPRSALERAAQEILGKLGQQS